MKIKILLLFLLISKSSSVMCQSWSEINSPTTSYISSCFFLNENLGWIVTGSGIYKTTNGGTNWVQQNFPAAPANDSRFFNSVNFINENTGIIACGNYLYSGHNPNLVSTILWTNDGGLNWTYKDLGSYNDYDSSAILVSPLIAYSIGQYGQSKKTVNGGNTWTPCSFSPNTGYSGRMLFALDPNNVYFAGLQNIFLSAAIGKMNSSTWMITDFPGYVMMQTIFFTSATKGWTAGNGGVIKITNDGGATWVDGNSGTTSDIYSLSFKNTTQGWATTLDGKILKTVDGGLTWSIDYTVTSPITEITFRNLNGFGYAVASNGKIYKYSPNLSVDTNSINNSIALYPNPTSGILNILATKAQLEKIELFDLQGRLVLSEKATGNQHTLFLSNLQNNPYLVKIYSETGISYKKVIKN